MQLYMTSLVINHTFIFLLEFTGKMPLHECCLSCKIFKTTSNQVGAYILTFTSQRQWSHTHQSPTRTKSLPSKVTNFLGIKLIGTRPFEELSESPSGHSFFPKKKKKIIWKIEHHHPTISTRTQKKKKKKRKEKNRGK